MILIFRLFFIVSVLLFCFAPPFYSEIFCLLSGVIYVLNAFFLIINNQEKINYFNILFSISFFFTNFIYPIFIYPQDSGYFPIFRNIPFEEKYISQATALCLLAYSAYALGYYSVWKKLNTDIPSTDKLKNINMDYHARQGLNYIVLLVFVIFLIFAGTNFLLGQYNTLPPTAYVISVLLKILLSTAIVLEFFYNKKIHRASPFKIIKDFNKVLLLISLTYIALFLRASERGQVIEFSLILFLLYTIFCNKVKLKLFIIFIFIGSIGLSIIGDNRIGNSFQISSVIDMGKDLIITNHNLYTAFEITQHQGILWGSPILANIVGIIPLGNYIFEFLTGVNLVEKTSAVILTKNALGDNPLWGVGTNMIGDLYMSFGAIGTIAVLFCTGRLFCQLFIQSYYQNRLRSILFYAFVFSVAIYLPRGSIFMLFQLLFGAWLVYELTKVRKNENRYRCNES